MINEVFFPGLGLNFTLNRVAITILGRPIYWYALIIITGFLLGWLYCSRKGPKLGISGDDFSDLLLWALPLGIVGARIYYVIFYLDLYTRADGSLDFAAMVRIWDGGLAIYGAVIAGLTYAAITGVNRAGMDVEGELETHGTTREDGATRA